jgi:hypothetical protein
MPNSDSHPAAVFVARLNWLRTYWTFFCRWQSFCEHSKVARAMRTSPLNPLAARITLAAIAISHGTFSDRYTISCVAMIAFQYRFVS